VLTAESQVSPSSDVDPLGAATDRLLGAAGGSGGGGSGGASGSNAATGSNQQQQQQQRSTSAANLGNATGSSVYANDFVREDQQYGQHSLQVRQSLSLL
jgi:hypothetical protein